MWTLGAAGDNPENLTEYTSCLCLHLPIPYPGVIPSFVGSDYYCETGSGRLEQRCYHFDDPPWDGEGCEGENEYCDRRGS